MIEVAVTAAMITIAMTLITIAIVLSIIISQNNHYTIETLS